MIGQPNQDGSKTLAEISPAMLSDSEEDETPLDIELSIRAKRLRFEQTLLRKCRDAYSRLQNGGLLCSQKKILVVDDEPYNCLAIVSILKSLKLANAESIVDVATSGRQALKFLNKNTRLPS